MSVKYVFEHDVASTTQTKLRLTRSGWWLFWSFKHAAMFGSSPSSCSAQMFLCSTLFFSLYQQTALNSLFLLWILLFRDHTVVSPQHGVSMKSVFPFIVSSSEGEMFLYSNWLLFDLFKFKCSFKTCLQRLTDQL